MRFKETINFSLTKLKRNKKNIFFMIVLTICGVILLCIFTFKQTFMNYINNYQNHSLDFKRLMVYPTYEELTEHGVDYDYDYEKILEIPHVIETYDYNLNLQGINVNELKNNKYSGLVVFTYGSNNTLPKNIIGKKIEENDTSVAICPKKIFMSYDDSSTNGEFINGNTILDKTLSIDVPTYNENMEKNGVYHKEYKVVGLYDPLETFVTPIECYISKRDMNELYFSAINSANSDGIGPRAVLVDDYKNISFVKEELEKIGFTGDLIVYTEYSLVDSINIICNIILAIISLALTLITILYVKKNNINNQKDVGLLKTLGFKNIDIYKNKINENLILSILSYINTIIIYVILIIIVNNLLERHLIFNNSEIGYNLFHFFITLFIVVIIPMIVNVAFLNQNLKKNSIELIRGDNL